jgi:hypothetical protein
MPKGSIVVAASTPTQISTRAIDIRREEARRAEAMARASQNVAEIKTDSIEESSVSQG